MKLTKQIIDGFVSYIDLKDIREFVKNQTKLSKENQKEKQDTYNKKI